MKKTKTNIKTSFSLLNSFVESQNYMGYSLYDSHTSPLPFHIFGHTISFLINQVVKRSPINIRKLIGVKKTYNPKGMGLFLHTYVIQKQIKNPLLIKELDEKISFFRDWLKNNTSKGYAGYCWGYHYPWPKSDGLLVPEGKPNSVVTAFNIRAIFQEYLISGDKSAIDLIEGATKFILEEIPRTDNDLGTCFAYTPVKKDMTINASLLAAEILAYYDYVHKTNRYNKTIKEVLRFTMNHQNEDGSWYYSFDPENGRPKKQIDFHQGYVLETIKKICDYSEIDINKYDQQIRLGLSFYKNQQFSPDGVSYWRIPKKFPIDIHNQSQGIITFSTFKDYDPTYLDFAKKIAKWTIENMQDPRGGFFYQKYKLITNKTNYLRWNQGWMLVALSTLMLNDK